MTRSSTPLCDAINEDDTQDALDAVLATLVLLVHNVPDRQLALEQIAQVERVYRNCSASVAVAPGRRWCTDGIR